MTHKAIILAVVLIAIGCDSGSIGEMRRYSTTLKRLAATNAPLTVVTAAIGNIPIYRPGSPEWIATTNIIAKYPAGDNKVLAEKLANSSAYGHTSTEDYQIWIFLDSKDRLTGYRVGVQ